MHPYDNNIHRHPDGSIDFDRYRSEALALRRSAMEETSKLGTAAKLFVIVAVTLAAIAVAPARNDANATCHDCAATTVGDRTMTEKPRVRSQWHAVPQYPPVY